MSEGVSRRGFLAGATSLGGLLVAGCDSEVYVPPQVRSGIVGVGDVLTMASQRLLMSGQPLVREYAAREVSRNFPQWGETNPKDEEFRRLLSGAFADWRLPVTGLVRRPITLSLAELRRLPRRTQATMHVCEQGWSAIAEWTGTPLMQVLRAAGGAMPEARYVVLDSYDGNYEGYDMFDVVHPQTILAYGMNGKDLPLGNGAPLRLRVERQCGYRSLKFIKSVTVVRSMEHLGKGAGSISADYDWHWYAGA
jgi:DMSO/TMAO reductase YedYZ molybdopterin-dependent catalytic subunit